MTVQKQTDGASGIVVTRNFVEAEDIAEALRRSGFAEVLHCRDTAIALDAVAGRDNSLDAGFVSFDRTDERFGTLMHTLQKTGTRLVLLNGDPRVAVGFGAAFLRRPFSNQELDQCIEGVMAGN